MNREIYHILLIDSSENNYHYIRELFQHSEIGKFTLTWVKTYDQALIKRGYCDYDGYLINYQEKNLLNWTRKVSPTPVIVLINRGENLNINLLKNGISDYLKYEELNSVLLQHCLRLVIENSKKSREVEEVNHKYSLQLRRLQEQKSSQTKELLNTIFEHSPNGILIVDNSGIIRFVNKTGIKLLNQPLNKLIGCYFGVPIINKHTTQIEVINRENKITTLEMSIAQTNWQKKPALVIIIRDITQEIERETALQKSEARYRNLYEKTPAMLHRVNANYTIVNVSDQWLETLGYQKEEVIGKKSVDFLTPESYQKAINVILPILFSQGFVNNIEYQFVKKNGEIIDILLSAIVEKDEQGNLEGALGVLIDITEKKRQEKELKIYHNYLEELVTEKTKALQESEQKYANLAEAVQVGLYINNAEGNCIYINQKCGELLDMTLAECSGTGWISRIHPDDLDRMLKHWQECFETKSPWEDEYRFIHPNGKIVCVYAQAVFQFNENGETTGSIGSLTDITERKKLEEELAKSEGMFRDLAANVPGAIFRYVVHPDGSDEIIYMSNTCENIWEFTVEQIRGNVSLLWQAIHPEDQPKMAESIRRSGQKLEPWFLEYRIITPSGQEKWLQGAGKPQLEENGDILWNSLIMDISQRKKAEEALQESESRYRRLVETLPAIIYSFNPNSGGIYYSAQVESILGYSISELQENPMLWHNSIHENDINLVDQGIKNCLEGNHFNLEYRLKDKYHKWHWFYDSSITSRVKNGEIIIDGLAIDITERKEMELALRDSEQKLQIAQETAHLGNWSWNLKTNQGYWSDEVYLIFSKNKDEFEHTLETFLECVHPEDRKLVLNTIKQQLKNKQNTSIYYRHISPNGSIKYLYEHTKVILDEHGESLEIIGTIQDITELKEKEQALIQSEKRFRAVFEQAAVGMVTFNISGYILSCNQKYTELTGYSADQLLGKHYCEITHPDDVDKWLPSRLDLIAGKINNYSVEKRYIKPDQTIQWVNATVSLVSNYQGEPDYCVAIIEDINERKKAEQELTYRLQIQTILAFISQELAIQNNLNLLPILGIIGYNFQASRVSIHCLHDNETKFSIFQEWCNQDITSIKEQFQGISTKSHSWWINQLTSDHHIIILNLNDFPPEAEQEKLFFIKEKIKAVICVPIFSSHGHLWGFISFDLMNNQKQLSYEQAEIDAQMLRIVGEMIYSYLSRQEAKKFLEESENHYRAIVEDQTELICRFLSDGRLTFVNNAYCRYFNKEQRQLIGKNWFSLLPLSEQKKQRQFLAKLEKLTPDNPILINEEKVIINGQIRWQEWTNRAIFDHNNNLIEFQGLGQDITERKEAEAALKESEARFRSIFSQASVGIALLNINGNFIDFNEAFTKFFGYTSSQMFHLNIPEITYPDDLAISLKNMQNLLEGKANFFSFEKRYLTAKGEIKWGNISVTLVRDADNKPLYFISVLDDIHHRKETEITLQKAKQAADEANFAKSQFLANMSHELRTPLNAILGFSQLMARSEQLSPEHQEYLQIINGAGEHLLSLINEILDLARIESGKIELNYEVFDLDNLLEGLQKILQIKANSKNLELIFTYNNELPRWLKTDQNKLRSILINLLSNAIKFTKKGLVKLTVKTLEQTENQVNLFFEIEDTGVGIAQSEIDHLFEVFSQSESGKNSGEGSGLGLAISKRFINLMGGDITVSSELAKGSIFSFNIIAELAISNNRVLTNINLPIISLQSSQEPPRILIVEDQEINRYFLVKLLENIGFKIKECANGQEALDLWQRWQPDLILMDMRMPVMDGYQAITTIRQQERNCQVINPVKIIAVTASALAQEKNVIIQAGCDDFISKPVKEAEICAQIAHYLNLSYTYKSSDSSTQLTPPSSSAKIEQEDLLTMSFEWRNNLYEAALAARSNKILQLIDDIPVNNKAIINKLTELVKQLNFEEIMSLTKISE